MFIMVHIIDRRENPKGKNLPNKQRFIDRDRDAVREAVREKIRDADFTDIGKDAPKKIKAKRALGTHEPIFRHGEGGIHEGVLPGNKKFVPGDRIKRPTGGGGSGQIGSPEGEGEDDFIFEISQKEFLNFLFEDLELPDMVKKALTGDEEFELERAGFTPHGPPSKLDLVRSIKNAKLRRKVVSSSKKRKQRELEEELKKLELIILDECRKDISYAKERIKEIEIELKKIKLRIKAIPFLDEFDLRFRRHEQVPVPITKAVMFCILDASASMSIWKKEMAKLFLLLLYRFLQRNYEKVVVIFIRHTQDAKEVDEQEFFYSQETGGTIVSSALKLMAKIIKDKFPLSEWNIYGCESSDGDDWADDLDIAQSLLANTILPAVQYYAYVEVKPKSEQQKSDLWEAFERINLPNFAMARISDVTQIYSIFRGLFKVRKESKNVA